MIALGSRWTWTSARSGADAIEPPWLAHMVADLDAIEAEERADPARSPRFDGRSLWRRLTGLAAALVAFIATACASTGATLRSGVGDAFLEHPPYYAGAGVLSATNGTRIAHLPIAYQRGATQPASFDPPGGRGTSVGRLLDDMNRYLDSLGATSGSTARPADATSSAPAAAPTPPDVRFGCLTETGLPDDDCAARGDSALGRGRQAMRLAVGRPSPQWTAWARDAARQGGADRVLVLTLEVGQYLPRQVGWRGTKALELGTGYTVKLPWLTSLETPVTVLQLTGALVDTAGKAIRIGAEGVVARRTRLVVSAIGGQELLGEEDAEAARTARRTDLPGQPLAWQVALRHLVSQLTGADVAAPGLARRP